MNGSIKPRPVVAVLAATGRGFMMHDDSISELLNEVSHVPCTARSDHRFLRGGARGSVKRARRDAYRWAVLLRHAGLCLTGRRSGIGDRIEGHQARDGRVVSV